MTVRALSKVAACAVLLTLSACGGGHSPSEPDAPPTADSLTLVRVDPATTTVLRQGAQVTVRARLRYAMARSTQGVITAFVLGSGGTGPSVIPTTGFPFAFVAGNRGEVELPVAFTIPAGTTSLDIQIFFDPDIDDGNSNNDGDTFVDIAYSARP
jgi:hypothetical protein